MWEKCRFDCYLCYKFLWLDTGEYHLGEMFGTWHVFHSQLCHNSQVSHKKILVHTNFYFSPPHHLQMMFICLSSFCISTTFAIFSQMCKNEMHLAFFGHWWQEFYHWRTNSDIFANSCHLLHIICAVFWIMLALIISALQTSWQIPHSWIS